MPVLWAERKLTCSTAWAPDKEPGCGEKTVRGLFPTAASGGARRQVFVRCRREEASPTGRALGGKECGGWFRFSWENLQCRVRRPQLQCPPHWGRPAFISGQLATERRDPHGEVQEQPENPQEPDLPRTCRGGLLRGLTSSPSLAVRFHLIQVFESSGASSEATHTVSVGEACRFPRTVEMVRSPIRSFHLTKTQ